MLWLQEKKKACGIDQNRYLKTAVGYGLTRFLLPVIAQQSMKGSVTVLAMDLVICGLVFYLSKRDSEQSYAAESLFFMSGIRFRRWRLCLRRRIGWW